MLIKLLKVKVSESASDIFRKLERVKRVERKRKLEEIQRRNRIVEKYARLWKENVFSGVAQNMNEYFLLMSDAVLNII